MSPMMIFQLMLNKYFKIVSLKYEIVNLKYFIKIWNSQIMGIA